MKKIIGISLTFMMIFSLAACRNKNVGMGNGNNNTSNGGTNVGRTAGLNNANSIYNDGIYSGYGDGHDNGNEKAIVVIKDGRITSVDLTRISQQDNVNIGNAARSGSNNTTGAGTDTAINSTPGATGDELTDARSNLIRAIIENQRDDIDIATNDRSVGAAIDNWKLAVRRALDQARR